MKRFIVIFCCAAVPSLAFAGPQALTCTTDPAKVAKDFSARTYAGVKKIAGIQPGDGWQDPSNLGNAFDLMEFAFYQLPQDPGKMQFNYDEDTGKASYVYVHKVYTDKDQQKLTRKIFALPALKTAFDHIKTGTLTTQDLDRLVAEAKVIPAKMKLKKVLETKKGDTDLLDADTKKTFFGADLASKVSVAVQTSMGTLAIGTPGQKSWFLEDPIACTSPDGTLITPKEVTGEKVPVPNDDSVAH
jgi:hypothetical protein